MSAKPFPSEVSAAAARVREWQAAFRTLGGDQERIHGANRTTEHPRTLLMSDIETLLRAVDG